MNLVVYISGHGFGHLAQLAPVLNRLHVIRPACRCLIRCALPQEELQARLDFEFALEQSDVDVGVVQHSAIEEDRDASIRHMRAWVAQFDEYIEREIECVRSFHPTLILSNISPLAFPVAKALHVPGIGLATLDWHTIYAHWLDADDPVIRKLAQAYGACEMLLTPPMAMDMQVFPHQRAISLIAAKPSVVPNPVAGDTRHKALVLFGGCGDPAFDIQALASMDDWLFLMPHVPDAAPCNVKSIGFTSRLRAVDVMPFVDVVVCKPGYGVLSECWQTATPMAWVERPDFPEFPMLKEWLDQHMPSAGMSRDTFRQGAWLETLQSACRCDRSFPALSGNGIASGADEAAAIIAGMG